MVTFAIIGVLAGLSLNLLLQFAVGINRLSKDDEKAGMKIGTRIFGPNVPSLQFGCLFIAILIFWIAYYYVLKFFSGGFLEYFFIFPLSSLLCTGVEAGAKMIVPEKQKEKSFKTFSALTGYDGLALVSFILTSRIAVNLLDGIILAFFFSLGCLLVSAILAEIRRRAFLEKVPHYLKGTPLALISMGLLSMVFAAVAGICFNLLELS